MDPETLDAQHTYHQHQLIQHGLQRGYTKDQVNRQLDALQKRYETQRTRLQAFNDILEKRRAAAGQTAGAANTNQPGASESVAGAQKAYGDYLTALRKFSEREKAISEGQADESWLLPRENQIEQVRAQKKQFEEGAKKYFQSQGPAYAAVFNNGLEEAQLVEQLKKLQNDTSADFGDRFAKSQQIRQRLAELSKSHQLMTTNPQQFLQSQGMTGTGSAFDASAPWSGGASAVLATPAPGPSSSDKPQQPAPQPGQAAQTPRTTDPTTPTQKSPEFFGNATGQALVPSPPVAPLKSRKDWQIARNRHMVEQGFGMPGSTFPVVGSSLAFSGSGAATEQPTMIDAGRDAITGLANQAVGIRDQAARNIGGAVAGRVSTFANNVARPFQSWFQQPLTGQADTRQPAALQGVPGVAPFGRENSGVAAIGAAGTQSEPRYLPSRLPAMRENLQREHQMTPQEVEDFAPFPAASKPQAPPTVVNAKPLPKTPPDSAVDKPIMQKRNGFDPVSRIAKLAFSAGYPGFGQQSSGLADYPGFGHSAAPSGYPMGYSNRSPAQSQAQQIEQRLRDLQLRWAMDGDPQAKAQLDAINQRLNLGQATTSGDAYKPVWGYPGSSNSSSVATDKVDEISPDDIERYQLAASGLTSGEAELNKQLEALKNKEDDSLDYKDLLDKMRQLSADNEDILSTFKERQQALANAAENFDPSGGTSLAYSALQGLGALGYNTLGSAVDYTGYSGLSAEHQKMKKWIDQNAHRLDPVIVDRLRQTYSPYSAMSAGFTDKVRNASKLPDYLEKSLSLDPMRELIAKRNESYRKAQEQKLRAEWQARQSKMLADKARIEAKYKSIFNDPLKRQRFGASPYENKPAPVSGTPTPPAAGGPTPPVQSTTPPVAPVGPTPPVQSTTPPPTPPAPQPGVRRGSSSRDIASDVLSRMMTAVTKQAAVSVPALAAMAAMSGNQTIVLPGPKKKKKKPPVEEELPVEKVVDLLKDLRKPRKVR
jgi:hypothetical protein